MKGYQHHYKRKNIRLRRILLVLVLAGIVYIIARNAGKLFLFGSIRIEKLRAIEDILKKSDIEKDRMKKRILIQKAVKKLNDLVDDAQVPNARVLIMLGQSYLRKGLLEYNKDLRNMYLDKSIYYFRKALAVAGGKDLSGKIYYELAKAYFYKGEYYYFESLTELNKAKKLGFEDENMEKLIDFIKNKKGNINQISQLIQNFKESRPDSVENYFYLAYQLKDQKRYDESMEYFNKILEYFQTADVDSEEQKYILTKTYYAMGWLSFNMKRYDQALNFYNKSLELDESAMTYYWLGKVYESLNKIHQAKKMWKNALNINPNFNFAKNKLNKTSKRR
ncbi:MAG: tetratricopeptide repeat protein [Spirochaetes bacterium]|nr:tetratricopeptide repeat protein [Spirochaetota bacterium]